MWVTSDTILKQRFSEDTLKLRKKLKEINRISGVNTKLSLISPATNILYEIKDWEITLHAKVEYRKHREKAECDKSNNWELGKQANGTPYSLLDLSIRIYQ